MQFDLKDPNYQDKINLMQSLFEVIDPELGINIIDLGLVYDIYLDKATKKITVEMTLSTPACPMGGMITNYAKLATEAVMPGYTTTVELVWEPAWDADKVSDAGKALLGW